MRDSGGAGGRNRTDMSFTARWILSPEGLVLVSFGIVPKSLLLLSVSPSPLSEYFPIFQDILDALGHKLVTSCLP